MEKKNSNLEAPQGRRNFLKSTTGLALAGMGAAMLPGQSLAGDAIYRVSKKDKKHKNFWKDVQKEFILDKRTCYMNIGTTGSMPKDVLKDFDKNNEIVAKYPWDMQGKFGSWPYIDTSVISEGFGCRADELVLSRNTTDGLCTIIGGLQFQEGDVVLTTHHEHIGLTSPLHAAKLRYGIEIVELDMPVDTGDNNVTVQDYVNLFADAIAEYGSRVRLVAFSHITYKTGTTLPAKEICDLAAANGIPSLVDGAHGIGMMNINFTEMNCDFYAGPGHKWQCGPGATGILYVRENAKRLEEFWWDRPNPLLFINASLGEFFDGSNAAKTMQYIGNDHYPQKQALVDSCLMWDAIGRQEIEDRVVGLGTLCKELIAEAFAGTGVTIYSPNVDGLRSGITSFNPFYDKADYDSIKTFRDRLREEYGYIIRYTDFPLAAGDTEKTYAMRISTHLFHDEKQVRGLVDAMAELYFDMV